MKSNFILFIYVLFLSFRNENITYKGQNIEFLARIRMTAVVAKASLFTELCLHLSYSVVQRHAATCPKNRVANSISPSCLFPQEVQSDTLLLYLDNEECVV